MATWSTYPAEFELSVAGVGLIYSRQITFNVSIPVRVWIQNTILLPNNPFTPTTGDDNEERANLLLDRINRGIFDIVSLQEVFDDDQRSQIINGYSDELYELETGPSAMSATSATRPSSSKSAGRHAKDARSSYTRTRFVLNGRMPKSVESHVSPPRGCRESMPAPRVSDSSFFDLRAQRLPM